MGGEIDAALGNIAIVGSGQVGTTIGLALREAERPEVRDVGVFDRDAAVARASFQRGSADRVLPTEDQVLAADTIMLCVPVPEILRLIALWGPAMRAGTFLVDTGSAKAKVVEAMRALPEHVHAIGGHPMAGTQDAGPVGASPELLHRAAFILTPARDDAAALHRGRVLARAVGARPVDMDAQTHDEITAVTSHLPHVAAFALTSLASCRLIEDEYVHDLMGRGYAGATRLAASNPEMVAGFLTANAPEVRRAVRGFIEILERLTSRLDEEPEALARFLSDLRPDRERVA